MSLKHRIMLEDIQDIIKNNLGTDTFIFSLEVLIPTGDDGQFTYQQFCNGNEQGESMLKMARQLEEVIEERDQ